MEIKVDDRVTAIAEFDGKSEIIGKTGVVKVFGITQVGVEFDEELQGNENTLDAAGHTCSGVCKDGHGWWCSLDILQLENS